MLNHTRGRLSPQTCGSVSRQTLQHTSTPSLAAPPQVEEGEITSTAWAPLHPDPVPLAACSPVPVPGELCLWA